ncbi:nucleotidyltransferase family protein [Viridibacillus sp. YIM B01967]|uniref:Nucleotidyltransferase family protein n=1 Tax=Viridibacillus soli TaxID=2798301 RepID=A0ABS1HAD7_9BACL|nr:nucleotidyltransferase family protein [Viridibacillus soli]MBK3496396.1 nucleotidyltransferase family protein [Viridibacillus soli]
MFLQSESDFIIAIEEDTWMMGILHTVQQLNLPDCWVCAGFVRSKVWDLLHDYKERTPLADIDVIYYNAEEMDEQVEKRFEQELLSIMPDEPWSVKNQARMHVLNGAASYVSSKDGMAQFPEIPTAVGVRLINSKIDVFAPYGVEGLLSYVVKPTPKFKKGMSLHNIYVKRIETKNWTKTWPKLTIKF